LSVLGGKGGAKVRLCVRISVSFSVLYVAEIVKRKTDSPRLIRQEKRKEETRIRGRGLSQKEPPLSAKWRYREKGTTALKKN